MIKIDTRAAAQALQEKALALRESARPVAQAGAQVIYDRARSLAPISDREHYFYGRGGRKYGPYRPGSLRDSIYQVYSQRKSRATYAEYHVSWNPEKAPYAGMVEFGTSRAPAQSFIGKAITETRGDVMAAMREKVAEVLK